MRVLLANSERGLRGGELQTLSLGLGLRDRGHEVHLAVTRGGALADRLEGELSFTPFRFESPPLVTPRGLARLIGDWKPDILHAQTSRAHANLWLARHMLAGAPPLVVSRRVAFKLSQGLTGYMKYRTGVAHYIPISHAVAARLVEAGIAEEFMTVIPSGIDIGRFRSSRGSEELLEHWGVERRQFLIATVGAFEREKGHEVLIRAAEKVREGHPEVRFLLFGEGSLRSKLEAEVMAKGLGDRIRFFPIERPLEEILPLFDLYVLPSLEEGLSTALIAALASGLPIVASGTGGIPEVVGSECGILVPPGDDTALTGAIMSLIDDGALRKGYAAAGRRRAEEFDITHTVDRTVQLYQTIRSEDG